MVVVDTSSIVAVLEQEPEAAMIAAALEQFTGLMISAASYVELCAVMQHKQGKGENTIVDRFLNEADIVIEPVTPGQAILAGEAYLRFKSLNFGDTFAYALAKEKKAALLFIGNDFRATDIEAAIGAH